MKWVTRRDIRVNRTATAWLIRRLSDPGRWTAFYAGHVGPSKDPPALPLNQSNQRIEVGQWVKLALSREAEAWAGVERDKRRTIHQFDTGPPCGGVKDIH